jgi:hypothetical protein
VAPAANSSAIQPDPAPILLLRRSRAAVRRSVESSSAARASTVSGSGCSWRCSRDPGTAAPCGGSAGVGADLSDRHCPTRSRRALAIYGREPIAVGVRTTEDDGPSVGYALRAMVASGGSCSNSTDEMKTEYDRLKRPSTSTTQRALVPAASVSRPVDDACAPGSLASGACGRKLPIAIVR